MSLWKSTLHLLRKQYSSKIIYNSARCSSDATDKDTFKRIEMKQKAIISRVTEVAVLIKNGVWGVFGDVWKLAKVNKKLLKQRDAYKLSLDELELFYEFNYEKNRLFPVMALAVLPFGNFLAVPLALKYPKHVLTHHFWSENQKYKFAEMDHKQRVSTYSSVISELSNNDAFQICPHWENVLDSVNNGRTPSGDELFKCVQLFEGEDAPFSFKNLSTSLREKLLIMHNMKTFFFKTDRLLSRGRFLLFSDYQIRNKSGPNFVPLARLKTYCFIRGVNAHNMTEKEMKDWYSQWLQFSKNLSDDNLSLILCAPALLTLNHSSNASLISKK